MSEWFRSSWSVVGFVALSTVAMYASVLIGVRIAGRRTLAELSAFDAVVTIALGSILATTALTPTPSYTEGATAVGTLLALQITLGWLRQRFPVFAASWTSNRSASSATVPSNHEAGWWDPQITDDELRSTLRVLGVFELDDVDDAVLEPNGKISARRHITLG